MSRAEGAHGPLTVLQLLAPGAAGGLESVVSMLVPGLVEAGVGVRALLMLSANEPRHQLEDTLGLAGARVTAIRLPARAYRREYQAIRRALTEEPPDLLHCHGYRADVIGGMAAARCALPVVSTVHGFTGGDWKNRVYEWLQCRALGRMTRVVAVSRPLTDELARRGVPVPRLAAIPNGWRPRGPGLTRREARAALGLPEQGVVIGWVGRLEQEKAPDDMLTALAKVGCGARLSFMGVGRLMASLEQRARSAGLEVTFHGLVPEAGRYLSAFDCLALSSRTEGTPIVLLEAMEAGVPIVATRVGGVPDLIGSAEAELVPPADPDALAEAIRRVISDPSAAAARAERARDRLHRVHAAGPWVTRYIELYRQVLSASRSG